MHKGHEDALSCNEIYMKSVIGTGCTAVWHSFIRNLKSSGFNILLIPVPYTLDPKVMLVKDTCYV